MASIHYFSENNTYKIDFDLTDEDDDAIALAVLGTFTCTQYYYNPNLTTADRYHLATINGRLDQDIKNTNNVTVSTVGHVVWYVQPDDNIKLNSGLEEELHIALVKWQWEGKQNTHEFWFYVKEIPFS